MGFFIKRYICAVSARRRLLLLFLLPPVVYLLLSAIIPDRYLVEQTILVPKNARVLVGTKPGSTLPFSKLISRSDAFFNNDFALILLARRMNSETAHRGEISPPATLKTLVPGTMNLKMKAENLAVIQYYGDDRNLGTTLVDFYSTRLVERLKTGGPGSKIGKGIKQVPARLTGRPIVKTARALWRPDRLFPAGILTLISLFLILIVIAVLEFSDPAFRSERQVARYLRLPIIGSLPDLERISQALKKGASPPRGK